MPETLLRPQTERATVRCAVYTRKSHEDGLEQEFNSLDAQREACEAFIRSQASRGWELAPGQYDDGGFSGGTMERPALKRLLKDIAGGEVEVLQRPGGVNDMECIGRNGLLAEQVAFCAVLVRHDRKPPEGGFDEGRGWACWTAVVVVSRGEGPPERRVVVCPARSRPGRCRPRHS